MATGIVPNFFAPLASRLKQLSALRTSLQCRAPPLATAMGKGNYSKHGGARGSKGTTKGGKGGEETRSKLRGVDSWNHLTKVLLKEPWVEPKSRRSAKPRARGACVFSRTCSAATGGRWRSRSAHKPSTLRTTLPWLSVVCLSPSWHGHNQKPTRHFLGRWLVRWMDRQERAKVSTLSQANPDAKTGTLLAHLPTKTTVPKYFAQTLGDWLTAEHSELVARPAMGVHLSACTLEAREGW